ncbi:MAG: F0F1 ATP synthase subunit epsilon [Pseudomonadota bacterium]
MKLVIVTPQAEKINREVDGVTLPGGMGEVGILPGHLPLMSTLDVGILRFESGGTETCLAVNRGFFEVLDDEVRVLTETCETPEEVDCGRAEDALKRARDRLDAAARDANVDVDRATTAIRRAIARLSVSQPRR